VYSQDQVDNLVGEVEKERDEAQTERDAAIAERKLWEGRAEIAEGKTEQLEVDLAEARAAHHVPPIHAWAQACAVAETEVARLRNEIDTIRARSRDVEAFLEQTKAQLRKIIESI
jgi:hypothetical protein